MLRKTTVVLLAVILIVCCAPITAALAAPEFSGLQGRWAEPCIEALADVRSHEDFETGHIPGAACVPVGGIADWPYEPEP